MRQHKHPSAWSECGEGTVTYWKWRVRRVEALLPLVFAAGLVIGATAALVLMKEVG